MTTFSAYSVKKVKLHNNTYDGLWGGYEVYIPSERYRFQTDIGVRGFDIPVVVQVSDGKALVIQGHRAHQD